MTGVIIQNDFSIVETRAIKQHCIANDISFVGSKLYRLDVFTAELEMGFMPVGSVEFVQEAFKTLGITQPEFDCYDDALYNAGFFKREIEICPAYKLDGESLSERFFVKPIQTKRFNGFVFKGFEHEGYDEYDKEQLAKLIEFRLSEEVYISEVVNFIAEWRVYVRNYDILSICRYDDGDTEPLISMHLIMMKALDVLGNRTVAVDIGLLDNGEFAVVELNDAWACGKYKEISNADYYRFLRTRWDEIISHK